jgi:hypothetical protein
MGNVSCRRSRPFVTLRWNWNRIGTPAFGRSVSSTGVVIIRSHSGAADWKKMVPLGGYKYDAAADRIRGSTVRTRDPEEIGGIRIWGGFAWGSLRYK